MASENDSVVSMETSQEAASEKPNGRSVKFIEDGDNINGSSKLYTEGLDEVTINNEPEVQIEIQKFEVPDGGFGWVIVFCSFMVHFIIGGIERSSGLLYLQFRERYNQSATASAWLLAVTSGIRLMLGPIVSAICARFSCRTAVMWGGFITCVSMVISGFSPSLYYLFLSFGLLGGIGRSLAYCPAVVIVGYYFDKKRGKSVGIATSGVGFGMFVIPLVIELVFNYYLFTGAFLIIAGIALNLVLTGSLMRPLSVHRKIQDIEKRKKEGLLSPPPEIEKRVHQPQHLKRNDNNLYDSIDFTIPVLKENASVRKNSSFSDMKRRLSSVVTFSKFRQSKGKETKKKKLFEFSLLRDFRFSCFCVAILLFTVAFQAAFTFLPAYIKQIGGSDTKAAFSIVIAGVMDGVGRITAGIITDFKRVKPYRLYVYNSVMFLVGAVSFIIPNLTDFLPLAITCGIYGFLIGLYISQKSVVIVDLLGPEKLNFSFGIMILFQGIGMFSGPTIGGLLKDINGKYDASFYFGGSAMYLGAIILVISNTYHYLQQKKEKT